VSAIGLDDSLPDGRSDETLLAGMAAGSAAAATAFVRRHQARVFGVARAMVGDPGLAEEVTQDAFVRVWRHGASFDARKGGVPAWLCTITRNLAIDSLRMRRPEPVDAGACLEQLAAIDGDPIDHITRQEVIERVQAAARGLPEAQQRALVLAACFGLTAAEISRMEQIPLGTAKTRIRSAILKLRSALSEEACLP
jgi:RNA polymerase sigma-70 factor (ECF subfamily)